MPTNQAAATLRQQHGRHTNAQDCTLAHTMELPCLPASRPGVRLSHPTLPQLPAQCCTVRCSLLSPICSRHPSHTKTFLIEFLQAMALSRREWKQVFCWELNDGLPLHSRKSTSRAGRPAVVVDPHCPRAQRRKSSQTTFRTQ
jgi:hypothetical protein